MFVVNAFFAHLYLGLIRCSAKTSEMQIECEAGTFTAGERASVTCKFDTDMSIDKRGILVEHQPTDNDALVCRWRKEQQKHRCTTANGSTFDAVINDRLRLEIPIASKDNAGMYICYILPDEGTTSQPCEMDLREGSTTYPESTTTVGTVNYAKDDSSSSPFLVPFIISVVVVLIMAVIVVILCRTRRARLSSILQMIPCCNEDADIEANDGNTDERSQPDEASPFLPSGDIQIPGEQPNTWLKLSAQSPFQKIKELLDDFRLSNSDSGKLVELLEREMDAITTCSACEKSSKVKADTSIVIDISPDLTIHLVNLQGDHIPMDERSRISKSEWLQKPDTRTNITSNRTTPGRHLRQPGARTKRYETPINIKTSAQLFDHVADCVKEFVQEQRLSGKKLRVDVVFSFQSEQDQQLTDARLANWTRTFRCVKEKVEDGRSRLLQAIKKKEIPCELEVGDIVSNDVSTLIWAAHKDPTCKIALIVGDGYNACYLQSTINADSPDEQHAEKFQMVHNVDFGAVLGNASLAPSWTVFDKTLDKCSDNPGNRIMEKMVSIRYLGEIISLILEELTKNNLLFQSHLDRTFLKIVFTHHMVSLVESENGDNFLLIKSVLKKTQVDNATDEDCRIVQYVTRIVLERAAHLAAAGLATLINRIGQPEETVVVAIGGLSLDIYHPYFKQVLEAKTWKLVKPGLKFKIVSSCVGREMGAAFIAAAFDYTILSTKYT